MRVVLTGGGTGGHVVPNLAVIEELRKKKGIELLYIGSANGIERRLIEKIGVPYLAVACGKLRRYFSFRNFLDFFKVPVGILQARRILREFKPDVVFSKGGYVSLPVVVAAGRMKLPVILHESDVIPGLATKLGLRYAQKVCLSFEESLQYLGKWKDKAVMTGTPVRSEVTGGDAEAGYKFTGLDKHRPVILVMGGSQGAQQINELIRGALDELLKRYQIVHLRGRGNLDISLKKRGYVQYEYLDEALFDVYAMCELVVSRGGANSLAEIAAVRKKAVIIPLGGHASRGDQLLNSQIYCNRYGWGMLAGEISSTNFVEAVDMIYKNDVDYSKAFVNGTKAIVKLILGK